MTAVPQNAPRVTEEDLEANIVSTEIVKHVSEGGQILRWAVITTKSGFGVVGDPSAAVSVANDDPEQGERYAIENAKRKLWPLMGYALKEKLTKLSEIGEPTSPEFAAYYGELCVYARPMSRLAYNKYRGWTLPEDENGDDGGFLIQNGEHTSWSPTNVFEKVYSFGVKPQETTFLDRLEIEKRALDTKRTKLDEFLRGPVFAELTPVEQNDLHEQADSMAHYSAVLWRRIERINYRK